MSARTTATDVKLFCWLDGFHPKSIQVKWYEDDKLLLNDAPKKIFQVSDKVYSALSEMSTSKQKWNKNTEFKCEAIHKSKDISEKWSRCKDNSIPKPLIRLEKPPLMSMLSEGQVTASCIVETALDPQVSWFGDGNTKLEGAKIFRQGERTVSNLTINIERLQSQTLTCKAEHQCFTKAEIKITVKEPVMKTPTVEIRRSFTDTESKEDIVLECVARDLPSGELAVRFQSIVAGTFDTQYVKLSENMDTLTARVTVPNNLQTQDNTFTCQIQQSHSEKWNSIISTGKLFGEPSVDVSVVSTKDGSTSPTQKLLCIGTGLNPQISWDPTRANNVINQVTMQADGRVKVISENSVQQQLWNSGVNVKCVVSDQGSSKRVEKSISVCPVHSSSKPRIHLEKPPLISILTEQQVTASCIVETALDIQVSWFREGNSKLTGAKNFKQSGRTVSNLTINIEQWKKWQTLTCKAEHQCFTKEEIKINIREPVTKTPTVEIRRSFTDTESKEDIVLECVARDLPSGELAVRFQSIVAGTFDTQYVKLSENMDTLTARVTVPNNLQTQDNTFTCQIQQSHSEKWNSIISTGKLFGEPSVDVSVVSTKDGSTSPTQKLLCIGTGLNPQISWDPTSANNVINQVTMQADGHVKVISENSVQQQLWNSGVSFKCVVSDQSSSKRVEKSISVCPDFAQVPQVYLLANSRSAKDGVSVTCLLLGHRLKDFKITWTLGTNSAPKVITPGHLKVHSNGTESFESVEKVPHAKWNAFEPISCEVTHPCFKIPQRHNISKTKDPKTPTIRFLRPSDEDLLDEQGKSLVCFIDGFYPADISVHWELNGLRLDMSCFANSLVSGPSASGSYSMHSTLTLQKSTFKEGALSCVVTHESSDKQISDTIKNVYASVEKSPPTMDLLQDKDQLVCLVYGYSPSAVNVTWRQNDMAVQRMSNITSAKGDDGKFMIKSHLKVQASEWTPGHTYTCLVDHVTGAQRLSITKTEFIEKTLYFDENKADAITVDQAEETWNMACAFIILFIITLFYGCSVTLIKVKSN